MQPESINASQEEVTSKLAQLQLIETDDLSKTSQDSPLIDTRLSELLRNLPVQIRQIYKSLGPVHQITPQYQIVNYSDDSLYFGLVEGGQKHGSGIQLWTKYGNILDGQYSAIDKNRNWKNDLIEGQCRMIYPNGDIFEGEFHFGLANGFGIFYSQKKVVKGIWVDNFLQGEGQEIRFDGRRYSGQFKNGKKSGFGVMYFKDSCKYEGEMKKNKINGQGCFVWNDNSYYNGEFSKGKINGNGIYVSGNGQQFQGYVKNECNHQFCETESAEGEHQSNYIQRIFFINEANSKLIIEKIRQQ